MKPARTPQEREQVAVEVPFHGSRLRVARAEDTVAYELRFGSEQDLKDARSILVRQQGRLSMERLEGLAARLGVTDALRTMLRETGPSA